ncbi:hypothetical protein FHR83_006323 [Actinoplanes campanulatus]|uniref:PQQ-like domain-containing protein n=1 Tax=Actinoplanes campanulatus TaxID=113559 RepID=A0A7W5AMT5_9ACTN|nr:DUF1707 domain-containing protein [Actinoplanes campanulatus]MBB3098624.1 hypothetical protein [Actinoplanes campanulatus]GGN36197.1 hypothetical protein GCM10010109_60920 [Actinoplanes campanulatus]GID39315.1 hypothetical protein Aca09nite_58210 [Actinoplanes campanulatus]
MTDLPRASHADRQHTTDLLDIALAEGRLDAAEHETRTGTAERAKDPQILAGLVADLPDRPGVRDWTNRLRVRAADRRDAVTWLGDALADGVLTAGEHERRLTKVAEVVTYRQLKRAMDGVGGPPFERERLFVTEADRARLAARLDRDLAAGLIGSGDHAELTAAVTDASRYGDLDAISADLAARTGTGRRADVPRRLEDAHADSRIPVSGHERRVARRRRPWRLAAAAATVAAVVIATVLVARVPDAAPPTATGRNMAIQWQAGPDRPSDVQATGTWVHADTLIRAREDLVTAYDAATGRQVWTFQPPDRQELCTMSRGVSDGVGILGLGADDDGLICNTLVAVDLTTGKTLWRRTRAVGDSGTSVAAVDDEVGIAGNTVVFKEGTGFAAVGLRDNRVKWRKAAPATCAGYSVTAAGNDAVLISACPEAAARLVMADPASGQVRFQVPLRMHPDDALVNRASNNKATVVLSTTPLVVRTTDDGTRTADAVLSFDARGNRRAAISLSQPDLDVGPAQIPGAYPGFIPYPGARVRSLAVVGDTLIIPARPAGGSEENRVAAFSLADGHRRWLTELPEQIIGAAADANRFVAFTYLGILHTLSPVDGAIVSEVPVDGWTNYPMHTDLRLLPGRYAVSNYHSSTETPPALMIG